MDTLALDYLNVESPGLGEIFLDDIQHAIALITFYPEIAPIAKGRARRKVLRRFPYSLIYSVVGEEVRILAVMHHHRRPFYWRHRN